MNELVSVIIVNWNGKRWLPSCLTSLGNQTYPDVEVVLVDNASEDSSLALVRDCYPWVRVIENETNLGFAGGNNVGIAVARGDLILLLNTDTWVEPNFIEDIARFFWTSTYDVVAPLEADYSGKGRTHPYATQIDRLGHPVYLRGKSAAAKNSFFLSGAALLFRRDLYVNSRGFDNHFFMYFEDIDWFWRLILLDRRIGHATDIFVHHAGAGSRQTGLVYESFLWRNQNVLQMLLKNYAWYTLLWILPLYLLQNVVEMIVFLLVGKPRIASSYLAGWRFNVEHLSRTLKERTWVQDNRRKTDRDVMKRMYPWSAKARHLWAFAKQKRRARMRQDSG